MRRSLAPSQRKDSLGTSSSSRPMEGSANPLHSLLKSKSLVKVGVSSANLSKTLPPNGGLQNLSVLLKKPFKVPEGCEITER